MNYPVLSFQISPEAAKTIEGAVRANSPHALATAVEKLSEFTRIPEPLLVGTGNGHAVRISGVWNRAHLQTLLWSLDCPPKYHADATSDGSIVANDDVTAAMLPPDGSRNRPEAYSIGVFQTARTEELFELEEWNECSALGAHSTPEGSVDEDLRPKVERVKELLRRRASSLDTLADLYADLLIPTRDLVCAHATQHCRNAQVREAVFAMLNLGVSGASMVLIPRIHAAAPDDLRQVVAEEVMQNAPHGSLDNYARLAFLLDDPQINVFEPKKLELESLNTPLLKGKRMANCADLVSGSKHSYTEYFTNAENVFGSAGILHARFVEAGESVRLQSSYVTAPAVIAKKSFFMAFFVSATNQGDGVSFICDIKGTANRQLGNANNYRHGDPELCRFAATLGLLALVGAHID